MLMIHLENWGRHYQGVLCDLYRVVNTYLDHLKFCVVCINGRRYVCFSECYVVSNDCDDTIPCLV